MSLYLSDTLAGTCGMANDAHVQYIRDRIQGHPYAGAQCKQASLQKIDALCLAGMLTDNIAEAILAEFDNNYATGKCNTTTGGSSSGPQCPDGYQYDAARSVCVESQTTTTVQPQRSDWLADNWPWLAAAVGLVVVYFITRRRR